MPSKLNKAIKIIQFRFLNCHSEKIARNAWESVFEWSQWLTKMLDLFKIFLKQVRRVFADIFTLFTFSCHSESNMPTYLSCSASATQTNGLNNMSTTLVHDKNNRISCPRLKSRMNKALDFCVHAVFIETRKLLESEYLIVW